MTKLEEKGRITLAILLTILFSFILIYSQLGKDIVSCENYNIMVNLNRISSDEKWLRYDLNYTSRLRGMLIYSLNLCKRLQNDADEYSQYIKEEKAFTNDELSELMKNIQSDFEDCNKYSTLYTSDSNRYYLINATIKVCTEMVNTFRSRLEKVVYQDIQDVMNGDIQELDDSVMMTRVNLLTRDLDSTTGINTIQLFLYLVVLLFCNITIYGGVGQRIRRTSENYNALCEHRSYYQKYSNYEQK